MKGWAAAVALLAVVIASAVGLWVTWDATQTSAGDPLDDRPLTLPSTSPPRARQRTLVTEPVPPCTVGAATVVGNPGDDWATLVIDTSHRLPADYAPTDLVAVTEAGFTGQDQVRRIVVADLSAMRKAAAAAGSPIDIVSAYRSYSYQQQLFDRRARLIGEAQAAEVVARPGHSEHQLGTAIDVVDPGTADLTPAFAATPQGRWVAAHAHEYGFILSYPEGATDRTCYAYEPWHLRYVGRDVASRIQSSGVTPRQWMLTEASAGAGAGG
jgi:D-alanyl-D-alanine carboxypeptidase